MDHTIPDEVISAALDGEPVDRSALERALAAPAGRDALAAFVLMRAALASDDLVPSAGFYASMETALAARRRPWLFSGVSVPGSLAASLAVLAIAASFWLGTAWRPSPLPANGGRSMANVSTDAPIAPKVQVPAPAPGARDARTPSAARPVASPAPCGQPPTPTRVLRFVPGVDWRAGS
jgi:negative regulator of sigma E activity